MSFPVPKAVASVGNFCSSLSAFLSVFLCDERDLLIQFPARRFIPLGACSLLLGLVFICVSVWGRGTHVHPPVCLHMCVLARGGLGLTLSVSLNYFPPYCLREGISLNLELMNFSRMADQPASPKNHHLGSAFPEVDLQACTTMPDFFYAALGDLNSRPRSCSRGNCFAY